jgi:hypothetical protein
MGSLVCCCATLPNPRKSEPRRILVPETLKLINHGSNGQVGGSEQVDHTTNALYSIRRVMTDAIFQSQTIHAQRENVNREWSVDEQSVIKVGT